MTNAEKKNIVLNPEKFRGAVFDKLASEDTGYSNYSYWRSTFRTFFKSKAVCLLVVLVVGIILMSFLYPMASLNDRAKVDYIISEGLHNYRLYDSEQNRQDKVGDIMRKVGLSPDFASRFPHEFSGGQRQRIGIARSLVMEPEFIVADEPISALDVSIRAQIINLLNQMRQERELTYLFIAHDLSVVRFISDRVRGCYFNVGAHTEGIPGQALHSPTFVPHEDSMETALLLTAGALSCL